MKKQRMTLHEAVRSNADFLTFLAQKAHSDEYRQKKERLEDGPHPTQDLLHEYVWGMLNEQHAGILRKHLSFCSGCMRQAARLELIKYEAEERLLDWANDAHTPVRHDHALHTPGPEIFEGLAVEFWEPVGAGEALVAASSAVTQTHEFQTDAGTINVVCAWGQAVGDEPAFIWLSWEADIQADRSFLIRFIDPETQAIRHEIRPGAIRKGNQTFTQDVLGFDPVSQKWAIAVLTSETEE